jgi:hypothetical protein
MMLFAKPLKKIAFLMLVTTNVFFVPVSTATEQLNGEQIAKRYADNRLADTERASVTFILRNAKGEERIRQFDWFVQDHPDGNRDVLVKFVAPQDIANTSFLIKEHVSQENDRWLYLPALKRVRRISSGDKGDSFVGSDFVYQDFEMSDGEIGRMKRSYKRLADQMIDGRDCWVVEVTTTDLQEQKEEAYGKRILYIDKSNDIAIKSEYFDKQMEKFKELTVKRVAEPYPGKFRAIEMHKTTLKTGHTTIVKWDHFIINQPLPEQVFTERALKNPVRM